MKNIKPQISQSTFSGFLSNLAGVVIGIALTLGVSKLMQNREEKDTERQLMALVKKELIENKNWLKNKQKEAASDFDAYKKILTNAGHWENFPSDSLIKWIVHSRRETVSFRSTSSWNNFKNSAVVTKLTNKNLIAKMDQSYFMIDKLDETINRYYVEKDNSNKNIRELYTENPVAYLDALMNNRDSKFFLERMVFLNDYDFMEFISITDLCIDYILYLIDEEGYDVKDVAGKNTTLEFDEFLEKHAK